MKLTIFLCSKTPLISCMVEMVVENLQYLEQFGNSRRMEMKIVRIENIPLVSMRILINQLSMCLMKILLRKKVLVDNDGVGTIVMLGKQVEVDGKIRKLKILQSKLQR